MKVWGQVILQEGSGIHFMQNGHSIVETALREHPGHHGTGHVYEIDIGQPVNLNGTSGITFQSKINL